MQQQTYSPWRPLRDARLLLICGILLAATVINGYLNYVSVRDSAQKTAVQQLAGEARLTGQNVKNVLLQMQRDAAIASQTPPIQGIVRSRKGGGVDPVDKSSYALWRDRLGTILISIMRLRPEYTQMRYIGLADNGREIVRVDRVGATLQRVEPPRLREKGEEPYMKRAVGLAPGESFFSAVTFDRKRGQTKGDGLPVIRAVMPVFDNQTGILFGVVVVNADYEKLLQKTFSEFQPPHKTFLISGLGDYLVYRPSRGTPDGLEFHENYSSKVSLAVQRFLENREKEAVITEGETVEYFVRLDILGDGKTQLGVAVEVPKAQLFDLAAAVGLQAIGLTLVMLIAVVAFAWLLIRHYTAPLTDMTNTILDASGTVDLPVWRDDELGALARAFVSLTDELESAEEKARSVLETINDGIITISATGQIITVNPACQDIFGYAAEECMGRNVKMLMPQRYSDNHDQYLSNYKQTGVKKIIGFGREVEGMRKDGSTFALDLSVSEMTIEGERMFTGIVRDISARKEAEAELAEQREFLGMVMDTNPNLVFVLDQALNVVQANKTFIETWPNSQREQVVEGALSAFFSQSDMDKFEDVHARAWEHGYSEGTELILFPDGLARSLTLQCVRFENKSGATFVLCVGRDQSDLEKLTDLLRESNRELDEFAYVASHDLKTPLRVIDNASSWLEEDLAGTLDADSRENLDLVRSRVKRMERLLDDLLEYSRIGRKLSKRDEEFVAGNVLLDDVLQLLTRHPETTVTVDPAFSMVKLPRMPLQQIFLNLIGNAIKHGEADHIQVDIGLEGVGDFYCFNVRDNGPGIAPEYHGKIFQMFQTLKPRDVVEGSGMGLAIVRKHVEQRGGRVWVESSEGGGATFSFTWKKHGDEPASNPNGR